MNHELPHDDLDRQLSAAPHFDDDGFSAGVIDALPPRRQKVRRTVLALATLSGIGVSLALPGVREALVQFHAVAFAPQGPTLVTLLTLTGMASVAAWAAFTA